MLSNPWLRGLAICGGAFLLATLAACADGGPGPASPSPEGPTGKAAVPYPVAAETSQVGTAEPGTTPPATASTAAPAIPSPATAAPTATSAPAASVEPATELELSIRMQDAKKEGGKLIHDVDSNRMVATHRIYELDVAELEKALGKKKDAKNVTLRLSCGAASMRTSPGTPGGAQPIGGFLYETRSCKVVKVVSAD